MTTIELTDAAIRRTVDNMARAADETPDEPGQLSRAAQAAFERAKAAAKVQDAKSAVKVAEANAKRESETHPALHACEITPPSAQGSQRTLFEF